MRRMVIFGLGSLVGALIDFAIGLALLKAGFSSWLALAGAMSVSAVVVYVIHQKVTFGDLHSSDLHAGRLAAFLANTAIVYVLRVALFEAAYSAGVTEALALAAALVGSFVVNFAISRVLIFSGSRGK